MVAEVLEHILSTVMSEVVFDVVCISTLEAQGHRHSGTGNLNSQLKLESLFGVGNLSPQLKLVSLLGVDIPQLKVEWLLGVGELSPELKFEVFFGADTPLLGVGNLHPQLILTQLINLIRRASARSVSRPIAFRTLVL